MMDSSFFTLSMWSMGGYAWYVWPAVIFVIVLLITNIILPWRRLRRLHAQYRTASNDASYSNESSS